MSISLITGGGGFIGSNMVRFLLKKNIKVRVLDNFETGKRENLAEVADDIEVLEGDVRDLSVVQKSLRGVEVVYHLAALGSVPRSIKDPASTHAVNVDGIFNMLQAGRDEGIRRFVFASSSSVYGQSPVLPQHEGLPFAPISPYAASKAIGEIYCRTFWETYQMETICLRYYNVFGPRQDPNSQYAAAIPLFVSALLHDQPPRIFDDGQQSRGFTYVDNVTQANWLAANAPDPKGQAMNISTATSVTVNEVVQEIQRLLHKEHIKPVYAPPRTGDIKKSLADITLARKVIAYEPAVSFRQGIQNAIEWYKENLS